jgi:hypothetical protein
MELNYAPQAKVRQNTPLLVLGCGVLSSIAALVALHFLQDHVEADIMSFTVRLIIPVGASIVGLVAGIGYFLGSLFFGVRVHGWLVWVMVALLVTTYFGAQYIEFLGEGPLINIQTKKRVGFWEYYHVTTIMMTQLPDSSSSRNTQPQGEPEPLGNLGYFYRVLGILGFALGGVIPTLCLRARPYCDLCQRYMKDKTLLNIPAAAPLKAFRMKRSFSFNTPENQEKLQTGVNTLMELGNAMRIGDRTNFDRILGENRKGKKGRVPLFAKMRLQHCVQCHQGTMIAELKAGENIQTDLARQLFSDPLAPETVQALIGQPIPQATPAPAPAATT